MLIFTHFPDWENSPLSIDALTYSFDEFKALENTLLSALITRRFVEVKPSKDDRMHRGYRAERNEVSRLGEVLQGEFDLKGAFVPSRGSGNQYACHEIVVSGWGAGCQEFLATKHHIAVTRCAILAGNKNWFGGSAERGDCGSSSRR